MVILALADKPRCTNRKLSWHRSSWRPLKSSKLLTNDWSDPSPQEIYRAQHLVMHRRIVFGSADDLKSIASARKVVVGLRREINLNDVRIRKESITLDDLSRHYQQREPVDRNPRISYSTKKNLCWLLQKWIEPRWGSYALSDIRAVEVELWLKNLALAPGSRCKIRNVMSLLFNHGRRHDLCERNPIEWVRQSAKRRAFPDILTTHEVQSLLANLRFRERTLVLLAVTTGLRRSEIFALKWKDVDFQAQQIHVTRSIVQNVVGLCKTESSQKPVPAHDDLVEALQQWHGHELQIARKLGVR